MGAGGAPAFLLLIFFKSVRTFLLPAGSDSAVFGLFGGFLDFRVLAKKLATCSPPWGALDPPTLGLTSDRFTTWTFWNSFFVASSPSAAAFSSFLTLSSATPAPTG